MNQSIINKGYLSLCIVRDCREKCFSTKVHRLVAEAFHGKKTGLVIDHIDNDKSNNHASNLEYVTNRYNIVKQKMNSEKGFIRKNFNKYGDTYTTEYRKNGKRFSFTSNNEIDCVKHYCEEMIKIDPSVVNLLKKHYKLVNKYENRNN